MERYSVYLALHGVLALTVSMVCGRWFSKAIITQGNEVAWRVVHSGGSMGGIMLIAFSSLIPLVQLSNTLISFFVYAIITGTWLFILAMITAAVTGERGLINSGARSNKFVFIGYMVASVCTLIGCGLLITGLVLAL